MRRIGVLHGQSANELERQANVAAFRQTLRHGQRNGYWQICGGIGRIAAHRLPAIYQWKEHVEVGALMSYGPSLVQLWRQAGIIAAKLLNGAKPADIPVEQPEVLCSF